MIERALVVGLGSIGERHLRLLREALPRAKILVLRHRNYEETPIYADACTTDLAEAIEFKPQIAIVSSPAPFHLHVANVLAEHGTHLLVEKPLSDSTNQVKPFLEKCRDHNVLVQVAYNLRFLETLRRFKAEVDKERVGRLLAVKCEIGQYLPGWRPTKDYRTTVSAQKSLGGGVLLELSHELDLLRWIFGEIDSLNSWYGQLSRLEIDVEDSAQLNISFANGVQGALSMDFIRHDATRKCIAIGESGSLMWNASDGEVSVFEAGSETWEVLYGNRPERDATYRQQVASFLDAVSLGKLQKDVATGKDGLEVLRVIEAARKSHQNNGIKTYIEKE